MLIDGHAHLDKVAAVDRAIADARAVGVERIVAVGMDVDSNLKTLDLAEHYPGIVYPAVGYHPWGIQVDEIENTLLFLNDNLDLCVALGEVGLDYRVKIKKAVQHEVFARVLALAGDKNKPVIVHSRFSEERCYKMVTQAGIERAVFHWYSGPLTVLNRILEAGYFISATPALSYSRPHQAAVKQAPLDRILIETDTPVVYEGSVSEPAHLVKTLREFSRLKEMSLEDLSRVTTENARRFFGF